jgi:hypothetical protein
MVDPIINTERPGWGRKIWNGVLAFLLKIKKLFARNVTTPPLPTIEPVNSDGLDDDQPYNEYSEAIGKIENVIVRTGLHKHIVASHKYLYELGRRDGALGIQMNITDIARASVQSMFRHIYVVLKGKIGALKAKLELEENIMLDNEKLYAQELSHYDYLKYQYRFFPKNHSFLLFLIYTVVALALIIADMPLALDLIQKGFNFPGEGYEHLFQPGKFLTVLKENWETSVTALGVALCTVYIKICYDEFIGTPYANKLMTSKMFLKENNIEADGEHSDRIAKENNLKNTIKVIILLITITAILFLAFFRIETAKEYNNENFSDTPWAHIAFVSITLLFPIVGGICLSYALNNLQNLLRYKRSKRQYESSRTQLLNAVEICALSRTNYEDISAAVEILIDENGVVEEYKNHLMAFYNRGYAIGAMQPEKYTKNEDFYTKIHEWRNIAITRKINHHIGKLN